MRRRTVLATAVAALVLTSEAPAHAGSAPVDLQVVDRQTGQPLKVWRRDGRLFVAGSPGDRYGLRVTNRTDGRVLVVMSVDGLNILSGETAGYDQRGYIFGPHESYELDGWRKSLSEIADFTFTRLPQSYAALTGRPANVGVIGIAVFNERVVAVAAAPAAPTPPPAAAPAKAANQSAAGVGAGTSVADIVVTAAKRSSRQASVPVAITAFTGSSRDAPPAERSDEKLGTGHGAREQSVMTIEPFERATPYPQFTGRVRSRRGGLGGGEAWARERGRGGLWLPRLRSEGGQ